MNGLSVVIPVHNEGAHIESFLSAFRAGLHGLEAELGEILLIENGSTDDTYEAGLRAAAAWPELVRVLRVERASYGEAIKRGLLEAAGETIGILECDALDSDFLGRSLAAIRGGRADIVVASKRLPGSVDKRPLKRRILTRLYNLVLRALFAFPGTDTHGLKTFRAGPAKELCRVSLTGDEVFQTELVLLAHRLGYRVLELPFSILERRVAPISVSRRLPKVLRTVRDLKRSLARYPRRP
jgi:glycosyltransferase involved in cell wall biosynthesis